MRLSRASVCPVFLAFSVALSTSISPALAVQPPSSAAPEYLQQRFIEPPTPVEQAPVVAPATNAEQPPMPDNPDQGFRLKSVGIVGMTVYPIHTFDSVFDSQFYKVITFGDAVVMARQITNRYRADGYVLSQAILSNQDLDQARRTGRLHIRVVEGFIHNVIVQNDHPEADRRGLIEQYARKVTEQQPLNTKTLERYMLLINDLPGVTARAIIRPSPDTFGAADLVVEVKNKPVEASFTSDNRGNKFLGPYQEQATVTENSVAGLGERTTMRVINSIPTPELHYVDIQHEEQVGAEGTRVIGTGSFGRTNPGGRIAPLDFKGRSDYLGLTVSHPFLRSRAENFSAHLTVDARNVDNDSLGTRLNLDRIRAYRLGGIYNTGDALHGVNLVDITVSQGTNGWGSTEAGVGRSRTVGAQDFVKVNYDLSRLQNLPLGFSVLTALSGQYSPDPLLLSEQYALGGVGFGQAYDTGELSGDSAVAGKVELRYGQPVDQLWLNSYQLYAYYDAGGVYINQPASGSPSVMSLASAGTGVRLNFTPRIYGYLELAKPLTRTVASLNNKDPRVFFSLTARY